MLIIVEKNIPATVPTIVLFGEIFEHSFFTPKYFPKKYPAISVIFVVTSK